MKKIRIIILALIVTLTLSAGNAFASEKSYEYLVIHLNENQDYFFNTSGDTPSIEQLYGKSLRNVRTSFLAFTPKKSGKYLFTMKTDGMSEMSIESERGIPSFAVHIDQAKSDALLSVNSNYELDDVKKYTYYLRAGKTYYFVDYGENFKVNPFSVRFEYQGEVTKESKMIDSITNAKATIFNTESKKTGEKLYFSETTLYKLDGYDIYRSTKEYSVFKKIATTKKATYIDKNVKEDHRYFYKVVGYRYINGQKYYTASNSSTKVVYNYK